MDIRKDYSRNRFGKYYLIQKLGNGGFGSVYRVFDEILKVEKALKILNLTNPNEAYKLFSEAAIPYKCQHNNIIKINGGEIIRFNDTLVFAIDMDLANGTSIENALKNSYFSVNKSLNIIRNILFAVEYSHLQGIIHRDIKPANILIDNGVPKLADFGLSTALGDIISPWKWYVTHAAPETFINDSIATVQTDIFALGMTLYRMVNNISDWEYHLQSIPNIGITLKSGNLIDKLPMSPIVPEKVIKIIKKACNKIPLKRYNTASEMRNAIEKLQPAYDWNKTSKSVWEGISGEKYRKKICFEFKNNRINVLIYNNNRKSRNDSKTFTNVSDAENYMFEYIKQTTLK
jgi:non-specific serine/threonine protein kinase